MQSKGWTKVKGRTLEEDHCEDGDSRKGKKSDGWRRRRRRQRGLWEWGKSVVSQKRDKMTAQTLCEA